MSAERCALLRGKSKSTPSAADFWYNTIVSTTRHGEESVRLGGSRQKGMLTKMAWNKSSEGATPVRAKAKPSAFHGLVAGIAVVAIATICYFVFLSGNDAKPQVKSPVKQEGLIKEVKPSAAPTNAVAVAEEPKEDAAKAARRAKLKAMTPEERINFLFEEMKHQPYDLRPSKGKSYRNGFEQILTWMFTSELGDPPPLLPKLSIRDEAHLVEILISPNNVVEGDTEKVKQAKEAVNLAKKELIKYIKDGGDVHNFLEYYHGQLVQANHEYKTANFEVNKLARTDPDLAPEYFNRVNAKLTEKGIKPLKPSRMLLKLADDQGIDLK